MAPSLLCLLCFPFRPHRRRFLWHPPTDRESARDELTQTKKSKEIELGAAAYVHVIYASPQNPTPFCYNCSDLPVIGTKACNKLAMHDTHEHVPRRAYISPPPAPSSPLVYDMCGAALSANSFCAPGLGDRDASLEAAWSPWLDYWTRGVTYRRT